MIFLFIFNYCHLNVLQDQHASSAYKRHIIIPIIDKAYCSRMCEPKILHVLLYRDQRSWYCSAFAVYGSLPYNTSTWFWFEWSGKELWIGTGATVGRNRLYLYRNYLQQIATARNLTVCGGYGFNSTWTIPGFYYMSGIVSLRPSVRSSIRLSGLSVRPVISSVSLVRPAGQFVRSVFQSVPSIRLSMRCFEGMTIVAVWPYLEIRLNCSTVSVQNAWVV